MVCAGQREERCAGRVGAAAAAGGAQREMGLKARTCTVGSSAISPAMILNTSPVLSAMLPELLDTDTSLCSGQVSVTRLKTLYIV